MNIDNSDISTVLSHYPILNSPQATPITGGRVNLTWLVTDNETKYILQRVNDNHTSLERADDTAAVLDELAKQGWSVSTIFRTNEGHSYVSSDGIWRLSSFVQSDGKAPNITSDVSRQLGSVLAKLHKDLAGIDQFFSKSPPHYRETSYHVEQLESLTDQLPESTKELAAEVASTYHQLAALPSSVPHQIIHGDPKLDNIFFHSGQPFTFIDWDTLMTDSPFVDIGDPIRSIAKTQPEPTSVIPAFCEGYFEIQSYNMSYADFCHAALNASQIIAVDNTARYLYDIVEKSLWQWDPNSGGTRDDFLISNARQTWNAFKLIEEIKQAN